MKSDNSGGTGFVMAIVFILVFFCWISDYASKVDKLAGIGEPSFFSILIFAMIITGLVVFIVVGLFGHKLKRFFR